MRVATSLCLHFWEWLFKAFDNIAQFGAAIRKIKQKEMENIDIHAVKVDTFSRFDLFSHSNLKKKNTVLIT